LTKSFIYNRVTVADRFDPSCFVGTDREAKREEIMTRSWMAQALTGITGAVLIAGSGMMTPASAQSVMQQCGQQYQAAKAANTLNGMNWNQFRTDCSARLKAQPAAAAPAAAAPAVPAANPLKPAPAATAVPEPTTATTPAAVAPAPAGTAKAVSPGRAAFIVRERQCGAEWKANKATLKAQTPGITWPKYLSQCNTRLKAGGQ
jgi:hypothetical protein